LSAKSVKSVFLCNECGYESAKWMGQCPACNSWNTMTEEKFSHPSSRSSAKTNNGTSSEPKRLAEIEITNEERFTTGITEFDRVLGGGIVKGSLVLVGGDPGIGKSTLLTQMCQTAYESGMILYVSGEESQKQIKIRSERLGVDNTNLLLMSETNMDYILNAIDKCEPSVMIVDSVQTVYLPALTSAPGSVSQVREVTMTLMRLAKERGIAIFLVGHVTKEGTIAGPRVLEHMVDCVLYFEGDQHQFYRVLRGVKNRFGSTNEIGVFEMTDTGLNEISNPSKILLEGRPENASGSCVVCTLEGTRSMLVEIQALVSQTNFNIPRRTSTGIDYNRISMLMAVLEKRAGFSLANQDAYVNVVGGMRIDEPAADLGIILSIASSYRNRPIAHDIVAIGEVGLTGEVRAVNSIQKRINEAANLGFKTCIIPKGNFDGKLDGLEIISVDNIKNAISLF